MPTKKILEQRESKPNVSQKSKLSYQIFTSFKNLPENSRAQLIYRLMDTYLTGYELMDVATYYLHQHNKLMQIEGRRKGANHLNLEGTEHLEF